MSRRILKRGRNTRNSKKISLPTKIAITTCLVFSLTFTTVSAESEDLETIYHVYVDGEHVGKVDSKNVVENLMDEKVASYSEENDELSLAIGEDISYISEKVFNPTYNNNKVTSALEDELSIKAQAIELTIAGNTVGYFKNKETADEVLRAFKAKYITEEDLEKFEKEKENQNDDKPVRQDDISLSVGESTIIDVIISEKVSLSKKKVVPDDILSVKQGVKMLEKGTLEEKKHLVKEGEVLGKIASNYDITTKKLLELNPSLNEDSILQIDQEINVTDYQPFADVIVKEEKKVEEKISYDIETVESNDLYKGDKKVSQDGQEGKKEVHYAIEMKNGQVINKETISESVTKKPVKKIIVKGTKVVPSRGSGSLHWPAVGGYISSHMGMRWGSMHKGMDIAGPSNRSILAADNGTVVSAGYDSGGYGNKIVINHNNGMKTIYAHLSSISVSPGQIVEKGSKIGVMGSTGNSTGIHLHFEVYKNGAMQNPSKYF
ncbi:peptidoglycan DD-metalloendopeptidase family protein [Virgibacillus byunsanensis]|uniref:Peptidoglycan DD-metalloendopeptidase family protein n=1 Tax=Virgibacillus byunsanensis TaxID=570945 RepID=A0ABW3LPJ3_9BACI